MLIALLAYWKEELHNLHCDLYAKGEEGHSLHYNVLSAEALRLSMCINDLQDTLLQQKGDQHD